ncbi:MAG: iron-containing alcohol dehydrogenase [Myxococcales bacterium]|nr:iron-containing alcohol dehydrogenase [Myxococcales bacterium]
MPPADPLARLLAGQYPDPDTGALLRAEAAAVEIAERLDGAEAELVAGLGFGPRLLVLADVDTAAALGQRVARALAARFTVQSIVLDRAPRTDAETVARLLAMVEPRVDAIVAVGAGTINDLAKLVAHARGLPQAVFATAPSMNGFTSVSASVLQGGIKRSVRTATPRGAFFDLRVLAAAPPRLIQAGLGDSACRSTAQVDWLLAHLVRDRPYRAAPFALLATDEAALLAEPGALVAGDVAALRHLVRTLVLSGFGMTICGGSYPASQGEHLLAHYVEMKGPRATTLHGEEVGVCAVAMAELQGAMLARDAPPTIYPSAVTEADVVAHFGPAVGAACWRELAPKLLDRAGADAANARLAQTWASVHDRLAAVALGPERLRAVLEAAGAPVTPAALGWSAGLYADARRHARAIRDRYTFLDLAADAAFTW